MARSREGIIDFVRGSELKVTKGRRGHLLVVSESVLVQVSRVEGGRLFLKCKKNLNPTDHV